MFANVRCRGAHTKSARVGSCKRKAPNAPLQTTPLDLPAQLAHRSWREATSDPEKYWQLDGRLFVFHFP
jgi:hypothetical protein